MHNPPTIRSSDVERLADIVLYLQQSLVLRLSEHFGRGGISMPQFFLLGHIATKPLSMTAIAERMSHTTAAATGLVDRLESRGYVKRVLVKDDRRMIFVSITKDGTALVATVRKDIISNLTEIMHLLSPQDQASWLSIYEKIYGYCQTQKLLQ